MASTVTAVNPFSCRSSEAACKIAARTCGSRGRPRRATFAVDSAMFFFYITYLNVNSERIKVTLTPYITVKEAPRAITFYSEAFGAKEVFRLTEPGGKVGHAELDFGGMTLMLSDEYPDFGAFSPVTIGGSPVKLHLYVPDVDATIDRAIQAGATLVRPIKDEFYGDRVGMIADPFGFSWFVSTRKEEVSPEEMQRRWNTAMAGGSA